MVGLEQSYTNFSLLEAALQTLFQFTAAKELN